MTGDQSGPTKTDLGTVKRAAKQDAKKADKPATARTRKRA